MKKTPEEDRMEQIITKYGAVTVCASFRPKESNIDSLFENALLVLCSKTGLTKEELLGKVDLKSKIETIRFFAIKEMIANSIQYRGVDGAVEYLENSFPVLKDIAIENSFPEFSNSDDVKFSRAKESALDMNYEEAIEIFSNLAKTQRSAQKPSFIKDLYLKLFLCYLAIKDPESAHQCRVNLILENEEAEECEVSTFMLEIYQSYISKNLAMLINTLRSDKNNKFTEDSFNASILLRIRTFDIFYRSTLPNKN